MVLAVVVVITPMIAIADIVVLAEETEDIIEVNELFSIPLSIVTLLAMEEVIIETIFESSDTNF